MATFGTAFAPTNQNQLNQLGSGSGGSGSFASSPTTPIQDAIQILRLRIPRVVGASALAPGSLLNAPGSAGVGGDLMAQLQRLFGTGISLPGQQQAGVTGLPTNLLAPTGAPSNALPGIPTQLPTPNIVPGSGGLAPMPTMPAGMRTQTPSALIPAAQPWRSSAPSGPAAPTFSAGPVASAPYIGGAGSGRGA